MDKVFIEGLEIEALIGIYDWERRIRQPLVFDLEMQFDNRVPAASDAIADTLDYKAVSKRVIEYVGQSQFGLVETLAERVAALVLDEFGVEHVRLKLSKPGAVRGARAVGVMIERTRQPGERLARPAQAVTDTVETPAPEAVEPASVAMAPEAGSAEQRETVAAAAAIGFDATHVGTGATAPAGVDGIDRIAAGEAGPSPLEAAMMAALSGWHAPRPAGLPETPDDDGVEPAAAEVAAESMQAPATEAQAEASDEAPAEGAAATPEEDSAEAWPEAAAEGFAEVAAEAASLAETPAGDFAEATAGAADVPAEAPLAETPAEPPAEASREEERAETPPPAAAPAEAEITLPPVTGPVEYERYADRPQTLAASVARKSAEAAAAATPSRANFMRDLDEAPVRPVSVPTPDEPDSLPPAATDDETDAAAAPPGEVPGSEVAPAEAAADLALDAAPSDAVASASAEDAASATIAPDAGSTAQNDADVVPTAAAPARAALPPPPRPRNPASDLGRTTRPAYLSLGSNIEPEQNLRSALMALRARFGEVIVSPVYRMPAVGFEGPDFLNAAAIIDSDLDPFALTRWLHGIEAAHGRMRTHVKNSSRTLDMDIIFFDDLVLDMPGGLQLPRPELRHAFVLKPMVDIAPGYVDPVRGVYLADLWASHPERDERFSTVII